MRTVGVQIRGIGISFLLLLVCLSSWTLVQSETTNGYSFVVSVPQIQSYEEIASDGHTYMHYAFQDCSFLTEPGKPKLPVLNYKVHVPSDAHNIQIRTQSQDATASQPAATAYPVETEVLTQKNDGSLVEQVFCKDSVFYTTPNIVYPQTLAWYTEAGNLRGVRFISVDVSPMQYDPFTNILTTHESITVTVSWESENDQTPTQIGVPYENIITNMRLLNYHEPQGLGSLDGGEAPRSGQVSYPLNLIDPANSADYLVITADSFYTSVGVQNLANHRVTYNGFNVSIVRLSAIYAAVGGVGQIPLYPELNDTESNQDLEIKTFIKYAYENWDHGARRLAYVLLVGDGYPIVSSYSIPLHPTIHESFEQQVGTDYWYTCLNDDNGDSFVNDNDTIADLIIGRFSIQTLSQLNTIVEKTINYELHPPQYPQQIWGAQAVLTSGFAGNDSGMNNMDVVRDEYVAPNLLEINQMFAEDYSDYVQAENDMKAFLNTGASLFIHNGHGCEFHWWIGSSEVHQWFDNNDVASLTNGEKLPIAIALSCSTGAFDNETDPCFGEQWIRVANKGAVAYLGSSRVSGSGSNNDLGEEIGNALLNEDNLILGSFILEAKLNLTHGSWINRLLYNLLGDPALDVGQTIQESPKPELSCSLQNFEMPDSNHVLLHGKIANVGKTAATNVRVELFNGDPQENGTIINEATRFVSVPARTEIPIEHLISMQPGWETGYSTDLYLFVDRLGFIDEICETNNICQEPLHFFIERYPTQFVSNGFYPSVYGDNIVYQDNRGQNYDIYMYSISTGQEVRITSHPTHQSSPVISGSVLVWSDMRNGNSDIYMYDLGEDGVYGTADDSGEVQITINESSQSAPALCGRYIVWQDYRNHCSDIYLYDLDASEEYRVTQDSLDHYNPSISGTKIVWQNAELKPEDPEGGGSSFGMSNISFYDLGIDGLFGTDDDTGVIALTHHAEKYFQISPVIHGNKIVWQDSRNTHDSTDIYMYDLGADGRYGTADDRPEVRITSNQFSQGAPQIYGNKIVWQDQRNGSGNLNIYLYDLDIDAEVQITMDTLNQATPAIYENKIVYQSPVRSLYLTFYLPSGMHQNNNPFAPSDPLPENGAQNIPVTLNRVSWSGGDPNPGDTVTYDVYFGNTTPLQKMASNQTETFFDDYSPLEDNTTYLWKVIAWDNHGACNQSTVWTFKTQIMGMPPENQEPDEPSHPVPSQAAENVPTSLSCISWDESSDPEDDYVTYDVYFGTSTSPPKVTANQTSLYYTIPPLSMDTMYYWQIIAWDNYGAQNASPIWHFKTKSDSAVVSITLTRPRAGYVYISNNEIMKRTFALFPLVIGDVSIEASATGTGIQRVQFYIDNMLQQTDVTAPYKWSWTEPAFFIHTIKVVVEDDSGNDVTDEIRVFKLF